MWQNIPFQGFGLGISLNHAGSLQLIEHLLTVRMSSGARSQPTPEFVEVYIGNGALNRRAMNVIENCRRHGLSISFHTAFLDLWNYLEPDDRGLPYTLEQINLLDPVWCNQDLMLTKLGGLREGVLFTGLMTSEAACGFASRHTAVQAQCPVPVLLENPPFRLIVGNMPFGAYFRQIAQEADCGLTLDVGHLQAASLLSAQPMSDLLKDYPFERVCEMHVAGGYIDATTGSYVDDHDAPIAAAIAEFLTELIPRCENLKAVTYELQNPDITEALDRFDCLYSAIAGCDRRFGQD